jgi:fructokinase
MVVVSCFPFDDAQQTDLLIEATASASTPLAIDPNPRSGMLRDRAEFVRGFEKAASGALLVKVGEDDAQLLYGTPLDELRTKLGGLGVGAVLATYGAGGAVIDAGETTVSRGISDLPGRIVDTMGGGDAVLATTAALVRDRLPADAEEWDAVLARAMDVAAATCRHEGALLRTPE